MGPSGGVVAGVRVLWKEGGREGRGGSTRVPEMGWLASVDRGRGRGGTVEEGVVVAHGGGGWGFFSVCGLGCGWVSTWLVEGRALGFK